MVSLSIQPLVILAIEQRRRQDAAAKGADKHVPDDGAVALQVARCVVVDIAAHNTVNVAPSNDKAQDDSALVHSLDIVRDPRNGDGDAWVDAHGSEERAGVLHARLGRRHQHDETGNANQGNGDVENGPLLDFVGPEACRDGGDSGGRIWWHAEQLIPDDGSLAGKAHVLDDGRQEQTEGVQRHEGAHVHEHAGVRLPVLDGRPEILHLEGFVLGRALLVLLESIQHTHAIIWGQEFCLVREVMHHEEGDEADQHCQCAFDDEDPGPPGNAPFAVQFLDSSRKETSKGAGQCGGGKEYGGSDTEFVALVPA